MFLGGPVVLTGCGVGDNPTEQTYVTEIADQVWEYAKAHPDGFTLDIRTMTEPTEGIAVSYAATQDSHSRDQLDYVVKHALKHDGYPGFDVIYENGVTYSLPRVGKDIKVNKWNGGVNNPTTLKWNGHGFDEPNR